MRQWRWADSISLNAFASAAAFSLWPLVTLVRRCTVAKVDSIVILSFRVSQCCDLRRTVADMSLTGRPQPRGRLSWGWIVT